MSVTARLEEKEIPALALQKSDDAQPTQDAEVLKARASIDQFLANNVRDHAYGLDESYGKDYDLKFKAKRELLLRAGKMAIEANNYYFLLAIHDAYSKLMKREVRSQIDTRHAQRVLTNWSNLLAEYFVHALNKNSKYAEEILNREKYVWHDIYYVPLFRRGADDLFKMVQIMLNVNAKCVLAQNRYSFPSGMLNSVMRAEAKNEEPVVSTQMLKSTCIDAENLSTAMQLGPKFVKALDQAPSHQIKTTRNSWLEKSVWQSPKWAIVAINAATNKQKYCQHCVKYLFDLLKDNKVTKEDALIVFQEMAKHKIKLSEDDLKLLISLKQDALLEYILKNREDVLKKSITAATLAAAGVAALKPSINIKTEVGVGTSFLLKELEAELKQVPVVAVAPAADAARVTASPLKTLRQPTETPALSVQQVVASPAVR